MTGFPIEFGVGGFSKEAAIRCREYLTEEGSRVSPREDFLKFRPFEMEIPAIFGVVFVISKYLEKYQVKFML
jgi:hypothetical protein